MYLLILILLSGFPTSCNTSELTPYISKLVSPASVLALVPSRLVSLSNQEPIVQFKSITHTHNFSFNNFSSLWCSKVVIHPGRPPLAICNLIDVCLMVFRSPCYTYHLLQVWLDTPPQEHFTLSCCGGRARRVANGLLLHGRPLARWNRLEHRESFDLVQTQALGKHQNQAPVKPGENYGNCTWSSAG